MIKGFGAGLTRRHVRKLIEVQDRVSEVVSAIKLVGKLLSVEKHANNSATKEKPKINTLVSKYSSPANLPPVEELNPGRK